MLLYKAVMLRLRHLVAFTLLGGCVTTGVPDWASESTPVHVRIGTHYGLVTVGDNPRPLYSVQGECVGGHRVAVDSARLDRLLKATFRVHRRRLKLSITPDIAPQLERQVRDTLGRLNIETQLLLDTSIVSDACPWAPKDRRGLLKRAKIADVIRSALPRFQTCYEAHLILDRDAAGQAVLVFAVAADGRVLRAALVEDTVGWGVSDCVRKTMMGLQFPKPRGGGIVTVSYPFIFDTR